MNWFVFTFESICELWLTRESHFARDICSYSPVRIHDPSLNVSSLIGLVHVSGRRRAGRGKKAHRSRAYFSLEVNPVVAARCETCARASPAFAAPPLEDANQ